MAKLKFVIACSIAMLVLVSAALGQTSKGFIVGTITDPNGAAVPGATIKATNSATGTSRETISQPDGSYRFDAVDPGNYKLDVSGTGFKSATRDVVVAAAQTTEASFPLEVGNPAKTAGGALRLGTQKWDSVFATETGIDNRPKP